MSSLVITKQSGNFFSLVLDGGAPIISEQNRLTTIGDFCNFKTANGANLILKQNILYSEITIITGVSHVPTSINDLWVSLIAAGFFDGIVSAGGVTATRFDELLDTFTYFGRDGQLLIVNESELKLDTIAISIFTESDRIKLDAIENEAQVNVQSDWNEVDPESDAFILNKPDFSAVGVFNVRFSGDGQDYTLPVGAVSFEAHINEGVQFPEDPDFLADLNTFTQTGATVTFKKTITAGQRIRIKYYL